MYPRTVGALPGRVPSSFPHLLRRRPTKTDQTVHPIPPGTRVKLDPDATYTELDGGTTPTFLYTRHDPKGTYVVAYGPNKHGDLEIVQRVGGRAGAWLWAEERFVTPYKDTPRESVDDTGNPAPWPVDVEGPADVLSAIAATLTEGLRDAIPHSPGCGRWARPAVGATPRGPHGRVGAPAGPPEGGRTVTRADDLARSRDAGEETPPSGGVSRETALAALGRAWCTPIAEHLPSQSDILTGTAPADVVSTLAALAEANIRLTRIIERSADR